MYKTWALSHPRHPKRIGKTSHLARGDRTGSPEAVRITGPGAKWYLASTVTSYKVQLHF